MKRGSRISLLSSVALIVLSLVFVTMSPVSAACPDGLTSYWMLEEDGGPYTDSVDDNTGQVGTAAPTQTPGIVGSAQQFNGTDTEINVAPDGSFGWGKNESFSIEYWVKRDSQAQPLGSLVEVVVGRNDSPATSLSWWTGILESGGIAAFALADRLGLDPPNLQGSTDIADGAWHHVVAVRDAETDLNLLYVDSQLEDSEQFIYQAGFESESANLNIGWLDIGFGIFYFAGAADEVALYRRALSSAEIQEHYNNGLAGQGPRYCVDLDNDGISDGEENGGPNNGDGNNDTFLDSEQNFVTSLLTQDESDYVTLELLAPLVGGSLSNCQAVDNPSPGDAPANTTYPFGFFEFTINVPVGDPAELKLIFPVGTNLDTYYKYGPPLPGNPVGWYEFLDDGTTGATISNNEVTLKFVDGGRGDDTAPDGAIVDQGGPATVTAAASGGGGGGGGGGCFIATASDG